MGAGAQVYVIIVASKGIRPMTTDVVMVAISTKTKITFNVAMYVEGGCKQWQWWTW